LAEGRSCEEKKNPLQTFTIEPRTFLDCRRGEKMMPGKVALTCMNQFMINKIFMAYRSRHAQHAMSDKGKQAKNTKNRTGPSGCTTDNLLRPPYMRMSTLETNGPCGPPVHPSTVPPTLYIGHGKFVTTRWQIRKYVVGRIGGRDSIVKVASDLNDLDDLDNQRLGYG
jgi:hypothetical protein